MTPILFVPGLLCSAEIFEAQAAALWPLGPTTVASTLEGDTVGEVARRILETAPPRFALAGISMGGYISLEIMRQAPGRVVRLALLDTTARPDTPDQTAQRRLTLEQARTGDFLSTALASLTQLLHPARRGDVIRLDPEAGVLTTVGVDLATRPAAERSADHAGGSAWGYGRELFGAFRHVVSTAEEGASICFAGPVGGSAWTDRQPDPNLNDRAVDA